jgi:hypothetical protein
MALKTERPFIWRTPIDNSNISIPEPFYHPYLSTPYEYSRLQTRDLSISPILSQSSILSPLSSSGSTYSTIGSSPSSPTIYTSQQTSQVGSSYSNVIGYGYHDNNGYTSPPTLSSATSSPSPPETPILQNVSPIHCMNECFCCWQNHQFLQWQFQQMIKQNHSRFQYNQHDVGTNFIPCN